MRISEAVRVILERLDVAAFRAAWPRLRPGQAALRSHHEALTVMHAARALCEAIPVKLRRESYRWLIGNGITPPVTYERLLGAPPVYADTTLLSVNAGHPEVVEAIGGVMLGALHESEADGDPARVTRARMQEARHRERRALGLRALV